nr:hypothetical protein Itr_chr01CG13150 [Ipomoea trifida]
MVDLSARSSWPTPSRGHLGRPLCGVILANPSEGSSWQNPSVGSSWPTPPRGHLGRLLRWVIFVDPSAASSWLTPWGQDQFEHKPNPTSSSGRHLKQASLSVRNAFSQAERDLRHAQPATRSARLSVFRDTLSPAEHGPQHAQPG